MKIKKDAEFAFCVIILIILQGSFAFGKVVYSNTPIKSIQKSEWKYISKFGYSPGVGSLNVRARFKTPLRDEAEQVYNISFHIYKDSDMEWVANEKLCSEKSTFSNKSITLSISKDGEWSGTFETTILQPDKYSVWFFAISDCGNTAFAKSSKIFKSNLIELEMKMLNHDLTHFSVEESTNLRNCFCFFLFYCCFGVYMGKQIKNIKRKTNELDYPYLFLVISCLLQVLSYSLQMIHLISYAADGEGIVAFDITGSILQGLSHFLVSILMILIIWGWSIKFTSFIDEDLHIPVLIMLGVLEIILACLRVSSEDDYNNFHSYDGVVGSVRFFFHAGLFLYFAIGFIKNKDSQNITEKYFYQLIFIFGTVYFMAFPLLIAVLELFPIYYQYTAVEFGTALIQTIAYVSLMNMISNNKSIYNMISKKANAVLPTFVSLGSQKDQQFQESIIFEYKQLKQLINASFFHITTFCIKNLVNEFAERCLWNIQKLRIKAESLLL